MDLITFLSASDNLPFSVALAMMLLLALIEGVGFVLGLAASGALDGLLGLDAGDADGSELTASSLDKLFGWLHVGTVPVLILLACFLVSFGTIGLALQAVVLTLSGHLLPWYLAVLVALPLSLPCVRVLGALFARALPHEETQSISHDALLGREATLVLGSASHRSPAQAKVRDQYGQIHYVMLEPDDPAISFAAGDTVVLVSRHGATYHAISTSSTSQFR